MNITFRQSILCFIGISLLITITIGGIGSYFMLKNAASTTYQYDNTTKAVLYLEAVKSNFWKAQSTMLQMALDRNPVLIKNNYNKVLALYRNNDELLTLYKNTESSGPEEDALYTVLVEKRNEFHKLNTNIFLKLL